MAPPLAAGGESGFLLELGALLCALALLARIGIGIGLSVIPLYLVGGVVAGLFDPFDLSSEFIEVGGQIGVVLLLFTLGLEYSADELVRGLRRNMPVGVADFALNFSLGLGAGILLGWSFEAAFLLGGATYISSSGIIAKLLTDLDRIGNRETPSVLSLLVMEDLAMALYLPLATVLLAGGAAFEAIRTVAIAVAVALLLLVVAVRFPGGLHRLVSSRSDEVLLLGMFGVVLVVAGAAERIQVSAGVGAFLVGIAISGALVDRVRAQVGPLRDLFAATFFVFFGLQIESDRLGEVALPAVALALVTGASKYAMGSWAARRDGAGIEGAARAGSILIVRGEFSIVIAGLGVSAGIEPALGAMVAAYVLVTAVTGAILTRYAGRLV